MIFQLYFRLEKIWFNIPEKLRFLMVGGFNTVFAYVLLNLLNMMLLSMFSKASEILLANIALFVQYVISVNVSFITMRYYVFQSHGKILTEWLKAWSVYLFLYFMNAPVLTIFIVHFGWSVWVAQAVYLIFSTILIFILHKYYSFRHRK